MLRISNLAQRTVGFSTLGSKLQDHPFSWGTFRSFKLLHRNQSNIFAATNLHEQGLSKHVSELPRKASISYTTLSKADDGLTLRPATHEDCDAVKKIDRNVGDGFDTVRYFFHENISMKTRFNQLLLKSGKVVGHLCGHAIEDGEAFVLRHGRLAVEHRGKGNFRKLLLGLLDAALAEYPHLQRMSYSAVHEYEIKKMIAKQPLWKWIMQRPVEMFPTNADEIKAICNSDTFRYLEEKFNTDMIIGFSKREALKLLTEVICHLDFAPLIPMIGFQPSGWKASTLVYQLQPETDLFVSRCPWTNEIKAFSLRTMTRGDYGVETNLEFYCDSTAGSEDLAITHLLHYIKEMAILLSDTKMLCSFHHPATVSRECVKHVLNTELGIASNIHNNWTANLISCSVADTLRLR